MKVLRLVLTSVLIVNLGVPAFAQAPPAATPAAAPATPIADAARAEAQVTPPVVTRSPGASVLTRTGAAVFAAGMAVALYGFINNKNGDYSEFGEAYSSNKPLGAAGIAAAFGGGALMFLGHRASSRASLDLNVGPTGVAVSKRVSW